MRPAVVSGPDDSTAGPLGPAVGAPRGGRQIIPRPALCRPGGPAPWAQLDESERRGITLDAVRAALSGAAGGGSLLGRERIVLDGFPDPGAPAAVLVALFEEAGEARVVLTRRAANLRAHTGEVSFPGGRLDDGESPEAAALREAGEEVGLDRASVDLVGRLSLLATFSSGTTITPVVGTLAHRPALVANPQEVEHVFDVALAELADNGVFREEHWTVAGRGRPEGDGSFPVWFFELPGDTVWGATARMLVELLRLVLDV